MNKSNTDDFLYSSELQWRQHFLPIESSPAPDESKLGFFEGCKYAIHTCRLLMMGAFVPLQYIQLLNVGYTIAEALSEKYAQQIINNKKK